jgi:hypothetical protein
MTNLAPLTLVLLVIGVTAALAENSFVWGLGPFLIALANEIARMIVLSREARDEPRV